MTTDLSVMPFKLVCIVDLRESIHFINKKIPKVLEIVTVTSVQLCDCGCNNLSFVLKGYGETTFRDMFFIPFECEYLEEKPINIIYSNPKILN